jgi:dihydrofolate reductase
MITLIAACSTNRIIGKDNTLIWNVPGDLKRFKNLTSGHVVLMGRKTFDSIGKPLPNRTNVVISRDTSLLIEGCLVYNDWREVLPLFDKKEIFVIGGGEIYKQLLPYADKIELTLIDKEFEGDTYFPNLDEKWVEEKIESLTCPEFDYHYITYKRK